MHPEVTSVYIPVKTKDYRFWAILLSILGHSILVGTVLYFHSEAPPPPMHTVLVSPEELSELQGQIQANQQNNADHVGQTLNDNQNEPNLAPTNSETAKIMQEIAQREAEFQAQQAQLAQQINAQHEAEQQRIVDELNQKFAQQQETLSDYETAESRIDEIEAGLRADMERASDVIQQRADDKRIKIISKNITSDGQNLPKDSNRTNSPQGGIQGGNGEPRQGVKNGTNSAGYLSQIQSIIDRNWHPPTNSNGKKLTVQFSIAPSGAISNVRVQGSVDEAFKNSLKKAVQSSSPLPPPPADAYEEFRDNSFTFIAD